LGTKKFKQKICTISKIKKMEKKVWKTKKNEKQLELFGHQ